MRRVRYLPPLALLVMAPAAAMAAPGAPAAVTPGAGDAQGFGAWRYVCHPADGGEAAAAGKVGAQAGKRCALVQVQRQKDSNKLLFSVEFSPAKAGASDGALFDGLLVLPFGLAVGQPLQLNVGGAPVQTLAIATCLPIGCLAPFKVDGGLLKKLIAGKSVEVGAVTAGQRRPVAFHVRTAGLAAGIARLEQAGG